MKTQKKYTQVQRMAAIEKQNQQLFSMLIQLGQEVQMVGGMSQTTLQVLKEMDGYEVAAEAFKKKVEEAKAQEEEATPTDSTKTIDYNVSQ